MSDQPGEKPEKPGRSSSSSSYSRPSASHPSEQTPELWYVNGVENPEIARRFLRSCNNTSDGVHVGGTPEGGWPPGQHRVILYLDDQEVGDFEFQVTP